MNAKNVILITGSDLATTALEMLEDYELVFTGRRPTKSQLIALCQRHNPLAILVHYSKITAVVMDAALALKVIAKHDNGVGVINVEAATARDIVVRAATGVSAAVISGHTWTLILVYAKSVILLNHHLREGHWDKSTHKSLELKGRTLGLVSPGAISSRAAKIVVAFGVKVLACDPYAKTVPPECERVDELKDLLMQADALPSHCPLTQHDKGMINAATLAQRKPGAILVNTACGGLIDDVALATALRVGTLHQAALDNLHGEPLTTLHIQQAIDNVVLSPHASGVNDVSYVKMGTAAAANILQVLQESAQTETTF